MRKYIIVILTVVLVSGLIFGMAIGVYALPNNQVTPTPTATPVPFFDVGSLGPIMSNMPEVIGAIIETFAQNNIPPYRITDVIFGTPTPILPLSLPKGQ